MNFETCGILQDLIYRYIFVLPYHKTNIRCYIIFTRDSTASQTTLCRNAVNRDCAVTRKLSSVVSKVTQ